MYIFYDFETSSKELLGQILSYAFIVTDENLEMLEELNGKIKLNRTQLPEVEAIMVNKIDVLEHQKEGLTEYDAAKKIFNFLQKQINEYGHLYLAGYNSNNFDLQFLRNLLIRYGYNPYFDGKLMNLDIIHFTQYAAFSYPEQFNWHLSKNVNNLPYYSFKLEQMGQINGIIAEKQSHDAREDVLLTISLVQFLEHKFDLALKDFRPVQLLRTSLGQPDFECAKQKIMAYPEAESPPQKFTYRYLLKIIGTKKEFIVLDLEKYEKLEQNNLTHILTCLNYINPNKSFFVLEELNSADRAKFSAALEKIKADKNLANLTKEKYFELIKKDWDIEYQIHEMGFERIDALNSLVKELMKNPDSYQKNLAELLKKRRILKDNYLIQLFNRVYLNYHPDAKIKDLRRYLLPRYVDGKLLRNPEGFCGLKEQFKKMDVLLADANTAEKDKKIITSLKNYYTDFCKVNELTAYL